MDTQGLVKAVGTRTLKAWSGLLVRGHLRPGQGCQYTDTQGLVRAVSTQAPKALRYQGMCGQPLKRDCLKAAPQ